MARTTSSASPARACVVTCRASASSRPSPTCQFVRRWRAPNIMRTADQRRNGRRLPPISSHELMGEFYQRLALPVQAVALRLRRLWPCDTATLPRYPMLVRVRARPAVAAFVGIALASCAHRREVPTAPVLDERGVTEVVGPTAVDREGWANDIVAAIRMTRKEPTAERACAVIAVIEQESGYQVDPAVPNLPRIVMKALEDKLSPLGRLAKPTLHAILDDQMRASIETLRTERDLDRLFRETISAKLP